MIKFNVIGMTSRAAFVELKTSSTFRGNCLDYATCVAIQEAVVAPDGFTKSIRLISDYDSVEAFLSFEWESHSNETSFLVSTENEKWRVHSSNKLEFIEEEIGALQQAAKQAAARLERAIEWATQYDETASRLMLEKRPDLC